MFKSLLMHFLLSPLEGRCSLVPTCDKGLDSLHQGADIGETGPLQCATAQNAKPAFDLVEPGTVSRSEMQMHSGMGFKPAIVFGFMRIEIVQDYMELSSRII
jgi:hypothetical protein